MSADWRIDDEIARIDEENRQIDAELAAKLVIAGFERDEAVAAIKNVNTNREEYQNDPGVHIRGDEDQPSEWTLKECNYPKEISGKFNPHQVRRIAEDLIDKF